MALNYQEELFRDAYIKHGEAYAAALEAGYAESTAKQASKWINPETLKSTNERVRKMYKPELRAAIDARLAEKQKELIADQDEILQYLTSVLRGKSRSSVLARDELGADRVIEKPPDEKERLKAADLLGKRYGLYTDNVNIDGLTKVVIVDDSDDDDE